MDYNATFYQQLQWLDYNRRRSNFRDTPPPNLNNWPFYPDPSTDSFTRISTEQAIEEHDLEEFKYDSIATDGQRIRILKVLPSNPNNPQVECELVESRLDLANHQSYEALSWCWVSYSCRIILS